MSTPIHKVSVNHISDQMYDATVEFPIKGRLYTDDNQALSRALAFDRYVRYRLRPCSVTSTHRPPGKLVWVVIVRFKAKSTSNALWSIGRVLRLTLQK